MDDTGSTTINRAEALALVLAIDEAFGMAFLAVATGFRSSATSPIVNPVYAATHLVRLIADAQPVVDRIREIAVDSR